MDRLTMGQLAKQLGLGRETIRHYENCGLITPTRDEQNGYRYFSPVDGLSILHTKLLHSYDQSLRSISENMKLWTLSQQDAMLTEYEAMLTRELDEIQRKISRIRRMRSFVREALATPTYLDMDLDGVYKLFVLGKYAAKGAVIQERSADWISKFPITDIGWHIAMRDVTDTSTSEIPVTISLTVLPEYVREHHYDVSPPVVFFPAGHSIRTILAVRNPFSLTHEDIEPYLAYVRARGLTICSDLTGRYSGCEFLDGKPTYFFTLRAIVC